MNKALFILFILLALTINIVNTTYIAVHDKGIVWDRIPKYQVKHIVFNFIDRNYINNCFQHVMNNNNLLLKCWVNGILVDVNIDIHYEYDNRIMDIYI